MITCLKRAMHSVLLVGTAILLMSSTGCEMAGRLAAGSSGSGELKGEVRSLPRFPGPLHVANSQDFFDF